LAVRARQISLRLGAVERHERVAAAREGESFGFAFQPGQFPDSLDARLPGFRIEIGEAGDGRRLVAQQ